MSGHTTRSQGFTLVELVVVVTILGLAAGIVAVRFSSPLRRARLRHSAEQWLSTDQLARQISQGTQGQVILKRIGGSTEIEMIDGGQVVRKRWVVDSPVQVELRGLDGVALEGLVYSKSIGSRDYTISFVEGKSMESLDIAGVTGYVRIPPKKK
jgi:prepilin-type N-terminal cleavage/methylation domain-containing protein